MKKILSAVVLILACLGILLFAAGCQSSSTTTGPGPSGSPVGTPIHAGSPLSTP